MIEVTALEGPAIAGKSISLSANDTGVPTMPPGITIAAVVRSNVEMPFARTVRERSVGAVALIVQLFPVAPPEPLALHATG